LKLPSIILKVLTIHYSVNHDFCETCIACNPLAEHPSWSVGLPDLFVAAGKGAIISVKIICSFNYIK
jgi:hypothetical protein